MAASFGEVEQVRVRERDACLRTIPKPASLIESSKARSWSICCWLCLLLVPQTFLGCGARTALELEPGSADASREASKDAPSDSPAAEAAKDAPNDSPASVNPLCPYALLASAPSPVPGYCPTHAQRSSFDAPDQAVGLAWTLALPGSTHLRSDIVVGPGQRVYVIVAASPEGNPSIVVALDKANVAWTLPFDSAPWAPLLLADGTLLVWTADNTIHKLNAAGQVLQTLPFPGTALGRPGVGSDGTLYFNFDPFSDAGARVLALDPSGVARWTSLASPQYGALSQMAMGKDDTVIVLSNAVLASPDDAGNAQFAGWVTALSPQDGSVQWRTRILESGYVHDGPAVGQDGSSYFVAWTENNTKAEFIVLDASGKLRVRTELSEPPWGGGTTFLSIGSDGGAFLKTGQAFLAVDAMGAERWRRYAHPNIDVGCTVDRSGRVLLSTVNLVELVDPVTGANLWSSTIKLPMIMDGGSGTIFYPGPAVLGDGILFMIDGNGTLFGIQ